MSYTTVEIGDAVIVELDRPAPPSSSTRITPQEFRRRFTVEEKAAIYTAAQSQPMVRCYIDDVAAAPYVDLADNYTVNCLNDLEALGLIAAGRAAEIATP